MRSTTLRTAAGISAGTRLRCSSSTKYAAVLAGGRHHQNALPGLRDLRVEARDDGQRIGDVGAAPAGARIGHLEVASRRGLAALDLDARGRHVQAPAGLVLGEHAGDVVVDDHDLVDVAEPLLREDADRRRAAAHAHALLFDAVDDRRRAGLDRRGSRRPRSAPRPACLLPSAIIRSQVTRPSFLLPPVRWCTPPSDSICEPYSDGGDVANRLALAAHRRLLRAEPAVGVDLHLEAAVAEDALGHDRDHVDALVLRGDDEGRRLVVRIGRARADAGDEHGCVGTSGLPSQASLLQEPGDARRTRLVTFRNSTTGSTRVSTPSKLP